MDMNILVVGGGGREHAIARALSCNSDVTIFSVMARKNPGIAVLSKRYLIEKETDVGNVANFASECGVNCAIIGPEAPLEAGIVDTLQKQGIPCVGPTRLAARIETDKAFCRNMMEKHRIPGCPNYRVFHDSDAACDYIDAYEGDLAVKPIGLTGGKGVRIMGTLDGGIVLEERLIGEEFTLQAFVDGNHLVPMPLVQDHKRAYEGDAGPNTGGMGTYSLENHLLPFVTHADYEAALEIMRSMVAAMAVEGQPYRGILYGQFMNTRDGPRVVEFNSRFGDPEAMNVLSLLESDFAAILCRIIEGTLSQAHVRFAPKATVCKYLVPEGYPAAPVSGAPITVGDYGGAILYYANVGEKNGRMITLQSRTMAFVGLGDSLAEAEEIADRAASSVTGGVWYRHDIGKPALLEKRIKHMKEIR
ncbi:MAG: phosphoribosylamine---glycine ligase [Methanofollis sp.]|nr:phosphoribosylamine---glycine ligase [Methanofollis sp.]